MTEYRVHIVILLLSLITLTGCQIDKLEPPRAVKGEIDLSDWNFHQNGNINLDGEAEFFWQKFTDEPGFDSSLDPDLYVDLPRVWTGLQVDGEELGGMGYATYRLKIHLSDDFQDQILAISSHEQSTAFEILVDDKVIISSGEVGKKREFSVPYTIPSSAAFVPPSQSFFLTIRMSNFHHRLGGIRQSIQLGTYEHIALSIDDQKKGEWVLLGIIFIIFIYHLILYLFRRKDKTPLYFSLICLVVFFRAGVTGQKVLIEEFSFINYGSFITLEYLTYFLSIPLSIHYMYHLFPGQIKTWIVKWSYYLALPFVVFSFLFPVYISSFIIPYFHIFFLTGLLFISFKLIQLSFKKEKYAGLVLLAASIMMLTTVNDILFVNQIIFTGFYVHYGLICLIFTQALVLAMKFSQAYAENEAMLEASRKFVPSEFLKKLQKPSLHDLKLGDQIQVNMSILFVDIRSFTTMSEKMRPDENFDFINSYLRRVGPLIRANEGFIDKYIGDAIMALFELPEQALQSAIDISREVEKYNEHREKIGQEPIEVGMGINTGSLMLGIIGEDQRLEGTVISDTVNLAARLETTTKVYNSTAIFGQNTLSSLKSSANFDFRLLDLVKVKGKSEKVFIYELLNCLPPADHAKRINSKSEFELGLDYLAKRNYEAALETFSLIFKENPSDHAASYFVKRCENYVKFGSGIDEILKD